MYSILLQTSEDLQIIKDKERMDKQSWKTIYSGYYIIV